MTERIIAAAIMHGGAAVSLPPPARHHTVMKSIAVTIPESEWPINGEQGFMTDAGRFVGRGEAARIALAAGHYAELLNHHIGVFSEDLW